jgi:hypothetical protein
MLRSFALMPRSINASFDRSTNASLDCSTNASLECGRAGARACVFQTGAGRSRPAACPPVSWDRTLPPVRARSRAAAAVGPATRGNKRVFARNTHTHTHTHTHTPLKHLHSPHHTKTHARTHRSAIYQKYTPLKYLHNPHNTEPQHNALSHTHTHT